MCIERQEHHFKLSSEKALKDLQTVEYTDIHYYVDANAREIHYAVVANALGEKLQLCIKGASLARYLDEFLNADEAQPESPTVEDIQDLIFAHYTVDRQWKFAYLSASVIALCSMSGGLGVGLAFLQTGSALAPAILCLAPLGIACFLFMSGVQSLRREGFNPVGITLMSLGATGFGATLGGAVALGLGSASLLTPGFAALLGLGAGLLLMMAVLVAIDHYHQPVVNPVVKQNMTTQLEAHIMPCHP